MKLESQLESWALYLRGDPTLPESATHRSARPSCRFEIKAVHSVKGDAFLRPTFSLFPFVSDSSIGPTESFNTRYS